VKKIAFVIPDSVELLDLAGPIQVFTEAKFYGLEVALEFYCFEHNITSSAGLPFGKIRHFSNAILQKGDYIFIPGVQFATMDTLLASNEVFFNWLKDCSLQGINLCAICNAAFLLGKAGLLDHKECTTHWRRADALQTIFPKARVLNDVLFVKTGNVYTSAGITAGIDLALSILEELTNPYFVHKVARGLVVYNRRSDQHTQQNIYLDYRNHIHPKIHQVQDYIIENIGSDISTKKLAMLVNTSSRNLTRIFKEYTGITIVEYVTKLRLEKAKTLKNNPNYTIDYIATQCGFKSARQLQRIFNDSVIKSR